MRTGKKMFLPIGFDALDLCLPAVLGHGPFLLLMCLRRFIWTDHDTAHPAVAILMRSGKAVSCISREKLGAMLGYRRKQTISEHMKVLVRHRLIVVHQSSEGQLPIVEMGRWRNPVGPGSPAKLEALETYASVWIEQLSAQVLCTARLEHGAAASIRSLNVKERAGLVKKFAGVDSPVIVKRTKRVEPIAPVQSIIPPFADRATEPRAPEAPQPPVPPRWPPLSTQLPPTPAGQLSWPELPLRVTPMPTSHPARAPRCGALITDDEE